MFTIFSYANTSYLLIQSNIFQILLVNLIFQIFLKISKNLCTLM